MYPFLPNPVGPSHYQPHHRFAMKKTLLLVAASIFVITGFTVLDYNSDRQADREAVNAAVLDYVEAIYQVEPERIEKSVDPTLRKVGYWYNDGQTEYTEMEMNYQQLYDLASSWNQSGRVPHDSQKDIEIYDVLDKTATAKLTASWGIDYMQLAKKDGAWKIMNIVWQRHPPGSN